MCVTAWYQIRVEGVRSSMGLTSQQLLMNIIDACAVIATMVAPLFDNWGLFGANGQSLIYFKWTPGVVLAIAGSAVLSVGVNLAILMVLGATSAVTYNVVGHFKTVLILAGSWIMLGYPLNAKNLAGIALAMVGMALYTASKLGGSASTPPATAKAEYTKVPQDDLPCAEEGREAPAAQP